MTLPSEPSHSPERLSVTLQRLLARSAGAGLQVREMMGILHGRGLQTIIVLLSLPFLSPVSIPGLSLPFGLAIALTGVRIALGRRPWLPRRILDLHLSHRALERMVGVGCAIYARIEKVVRPRLLVVVDSPGMSVLIGGSIAAAGILLSLPIPPPFPLTNTIPGLAIILLSLGLIERDGILILAGHFVTALGIAYIAAIAILGTAGLQRVWNLITSA